jgi:hypothetical protein
MSNEGTTMYADRIISALNECQSGGAVLIATAEDGAGGYGRVVVDPWSTIEVRIFGWPMLDPADGEVHNGHLLTLMRLGFQFDGIDWVWQRRYMSALVPVAAHAADRALLEVWQLAAGTRAASLVEIRVLSEIELAAITDGSACDRCLSECHHGA